MKKFSDVFTSIRFAKLDPEHDKSHKGGSTDDEMHYTVGEKEWEQQVKHVKKRAMQEEKETPPIGVRSLYTKMYAKHGGIASKTKEAQSKAYAEVEKKHGKQMRDSLEAFHKKNMNEAVKDKFDIGEYDQEGDMAKSDLRSILANAKRVHDMLEDDDNLPEWVQSKITKAEDYISTVANYMEAEMNEEVEIEEGMQQTLRKYVPGYAKHQLNKKMDAQAYASGDSIKKTVDKDVNYGRYKKIADKLKNEEVELDELSNELLHRYKEKAADDARASDAKGDFKKGDKRFSGIVSATKKQFANRKIPKMNEEQQIDEISAETKSSYVQKAKKEVEELKPHAQSGEYKDIAQNLIKKREKGIAMAKEEVEELDELSKSTLASYAKKASHDAKIQHGIGKDFERIAMTSRKPSYKTAATTWEKKYKSDARRREAGVGKAIDRLAKEEVELDEENKPTNPELWARAKSMAKSKFDVYPSAYANGWAAKWYKSKGGGWRSVNEENYEVTVMHTTKDGDKGEHTHKITNADSSRHAKNIALQRHEKMLKSKNTEIRGMATTTAKMVEAKEDDVPFTPDKPKKVAVAGKHGAGYSTARHLARQAMQKQVEKMKKKPIKEESRKVKIIKDIVKKDKFESEPIISKTVDDKES